jgi:ATP-binding cassette subfamily B protein
MIAYDGVQGFEAGVAAFDDKIVQLDPRRDPAGLPAREIRFEKVSFHYPGSERAVLDQLDLVLPAGKCTAIVGLNGAGDDAGQALARLYGRAMADLVDGIDAHSFGVDAWRAHRVIWTSTVMNLPPRTSASRRGAGADRERSARLRRAGI